MHGRPKITLSKHLVSQRSRTRVITADASLDLSEDVILLFDSDILEVRGGVATFIEDVIDDGVPCQLVSYLSGQGLIAW
ncbi:unnamed protein product [Prunus armeniaca]